MTVEADIESLRADIDAQLRAHSIVINRLETRVDSLEREVAALTEALAKLISNIGHHSSRLTEIGLKLDRVLRHADLEDATLPKMQEHLELLPDLLGKLQALIDTNARHAEREDVLLDEEPDSDLVTRTVIVKPRLTPPK